MQRFAGSRISDHQDELFTSSSDEAMSRTARPDECLRPLHGILFPMLREGYIGAASLDERR